MLFAPKTKLCFGKSTNTSNRKENDKMPSPLREGQIAYLKSGLDQGEVRPAQKLS
jgi:hypothetical protein